MHRHVRARFAVAFTAAVVLVSPRAARAAPAAAIEAAFVIDATGSMAGFIQGARRRVWEIASGLSRPGVPLRIGFVAYRDRGDAFVTKVIPLSDDLDAAEQALRTIEAAGGGDAPEAVNRAMADAVQRLGWSRGPGSVRWLFLVGDAPPHANEAGEIPWPESVGRARALGITIHTLQCGSDPETARVWRAIARKGGGASAALDPETALAAVSTPFDAELAALARQLAETVVATGDAASRRAIVERSRTVLAVDAATAASRLAFLERSGRRLGAGWNDLVSRAERGEIDPATLPDEAWPDALRGAPAEVRRQWLEDQVERRRGLWSEVAWWSRRRDEKLRAARESGASERFEALLQRLLATTTKEPAPRPGDGGG